MDVLHKAKKQRSYTVGEASAMLCISERSLWRLMKTGEVRYRQRRAQCQRYISTAEVARVLNLWENAR